MLVDDALSTLVDDYGKRFLAFTERLDLGDESGSTGAIELIERLGFRVEERPLFDSYMWDGRSFNGNLSDRYLLHDLGHWLVASDERRTLPEFGLGHGPETGVTMQAPCIMGVEDRDREEMRACLVGIAIQHALDQPCGVIADEVGLTLFGKLEDPKGAWNDEFGWLCANGYLTPEGWPTCVGDGLASGKPMRM